MTLEILDSSELDELPDGMGPRCEEPGCVEPVAAYGGRGRRPTKCDTHRGSKGSKTVSGGRANTKLAHQAACVLAQTHAMKALGIHFLGMPKTASSIGMAETSFIEMATEALESDPGMCRVILRLGTKSSKIALLMVYGQFLAAVVPIAVMEYQEKKAAELEALENAA